MKTSDFRLSPGRLAALTAAAILAAVGEAEANPKGGQVVAGSATITAPSSNQLDIAQSTDRAAINWMSFNIAPNERTTFQQPSANSMTLNRVQAGDPSVIAGRLQANGQIVLVNPSGIVFAKGSQVDVNSLIATPTDITNQNFMAGRMKFDIPSRDPRATVVNHGTITVAQKGFAALVAPGVANSGVIQAKLGKVVLAGAETYTVDFYGDGLINFDVGSKVTAVPRGPDGKPVTSLVSNSGLIDAPGGTVLLTADAAAGIVASVVDVPGRIAARSAAGRAGAVTIDAGPGNAARVSGNIDVSGTGPGQTGGTATVTGGSVALAATARIDARGNAGGGTVEIGGGPHGKDPKVRNARTTTIAAGAVLDASAVARGKGGAVTVWADDTTIFDGSILAKGGAFGGDGGWIETSGKHTLVVGPPASVSAASPKGKTGQWLLDPDSNIDITGTTSGVACAGAPLTCTPFADSATLSAGTIVAALNGGTSVTVTTERSDGLQQGNIAVDAAIALTNPRTVALSLSAGTGGGAGSIAVRQRISDTGSGGTLSLDLTAGAGIAFSSPVTVAGSLSATAGTSSLGPVPSISQTAAGALKIGGAASFTNLRDGGKIALSTPTNSLVGPVGLDTTGAGANASLTNNLAGGTILAGTAVGGALTVTSAGPITQAPGTSVTTAGANLSAKGFPITLTNDGNDFDTVLGTALTATGAAITIHTNSMQFGNILATGPLSVTASTGPIIQLPGTTVTAAGTTLISGSGFGNIILANAGNDFNTGGTSLAANGAVVTIADANALQLGNVTAAGPLSVTAGGAITQAAATSVTAAGTTLAALGFPITVANPGNDFDTGGTSLAASGAAITIADANALQLGNVTASGPLLVTSLTGPITQAGDTSVIAAGTTLVSGVAPHPPANITLDSPDNDFDTAAGTSLTASGAAITVVDTNALRLRAVTATGTLSVAAGGAITQADPIVAPNLVARTLNDAGAPIILDDLGNKIPGDVTLSALNSSGTAAAPGAITFVDGTGFTVVPVVRPFPAQLGVVNRGQTIILATTLAGGQITNHGAIDSTGGSPGGDIAILADAMTLAGATVDAGSARVVLGPYNPTRTIRLVGTGGATAPDALNLTNADLATVTTSLLQIGANGAGYSNGTITVSGAAASPTATLVLVSAGDIADAPPDTIRATNLGLTAGGSVHLKGLNGVTTLAGTAGAAFAFADSVDTLTVGVVPTPVPPALVSVRLTAGVPSIADAAPDRITGITANSVSLRNTGNLTIADPVTAATTVAMQDGGALAINAAVSGGAGTPAGQFYSDKITIGAPVSFPGGLVLIAPNTPTFGIDLASAAPPPPATLELSGAALDQITAQTMQLGFLTGFSGAITVSGVVSPAHAPNLALVTGGAITEGPLGVVGAANLALWAGGSISFPNPNTVAVLAGRAGATGSAASTFLFRNVEPLTIGEVDGLVAAGGPGAVDPSILGVATSGGNIIVETTGLAANLTLAETVNANGFDLASLVPKTALGAAPGLIGLSSAGTITQAPAGIIVGAGLALSAKDDVGLGEANRLGAGDVGGVPTGSGTLAGDLLSSVLFRADRAATAAGAGLVVGTVDAVDSFGARMIDQRTGTALTAGLSGVVTPGGAANIIIETTTSGNLVLNAPVNANGGTAVLGAAPGLIGLSSAGTITQAPAGIIVGAGLALSAVSDVGLGEANRLGAGDVGGVPTGSGTLAGDLLSSVLFRADRAATAAGAGLVVGTVDAVDSFGARMIDQRTGTALTAGLSGVVTPGGAANIIIETTTSGNLVLNAPVNANGGTAVLGAALGLIGLSSAGTITQAPAGIIVGAGLALSAKDDVGLGEANRLGANDVGGVPTGSGTLAGDLLSSVLFRADRAATAAGAGLVVGTVDAVDSFGARMIDQRTGTALTAGLSGVVTPGGAANIIIETTTSGNLVLNAPVNANGGTAVLGAAPGLIGLSSAGTITQAPAGLIVGAGLELSAVGGVGLGDANRLGAGDVGGVPTGSGTLAGDLLSSVLFRADRAATAAGAGLTVGTVDVVDSFGARMFDQRTGTALTAGLSGVVTANGNILLETTTAGNLALNQAVNAGTKSVALASAGTLTQDPAPIVAASLAIVAADRVSLGAFGGPADLNQVGTLAGKVVNAGESFVFRNDALTLTIGTVDVSDSFGARLAALPGPLSGVVTNNANIGLRVTTSGDLVLTQPVAAGTAGVGLESAGQIRQTGLGAVTGNALEVSAVGAVSLPEANAVPLLAGQVTGAGNSLLYRSEEAGLTVGTVGPLLEQGAGAPPGSRMLSVGALSGVLTANGNILLETTTAGNLALNQAVNAGTGSVALASAGTLTQDPAPIIASSLAIVSANRVSLGAFGGPADLNQVGTLAGKVVNAGESFVFRNDALTLTIGTVDVSDSFGARLAALPGPLSGVVTNNANIGLRVTTSGDLVLTQPVAAGTAAVGLESAGQIRQTGGTVTGNALEVSAVGAVSLPEANAVPLLAGQATGAGSGFLLRDDSTTLTVGTVGPLLEQGVGAPTGSRMLSVGALSGVTTSNGNLTLETTTAGDLVLAQNVNAGGGLAALTAAGSALEAGGSVTASGLTADAGVNVTFDNGANAVGTLTGAASNGAFRFTNAGALTVGGIAAAPTTAGDVLIQTDAPGAPLTLAGNIAGGGRAIFDTAGPFAQLGTVAIGAPVLAVDTTGAGVARLLSFITTGSNADAVANLGPTGTTSNPMQFDNLAAPGSVVLLFADGGTVDGVMHVSQLGLSGTGASAALFGSIAGDATGAAAALGVRNPGPEPTYLFNNCIIAGTSCVVLPANALVPPQMVSDITLTLLIPFPPFSLIDFATSDPLRPRRQGDPDFPVINIFDEERLCGGMSGSGEPAQEPCR